MAICQFYQQGNCKFGDRCRNEHVDYNAPRGQGQYNQQDTRGRSGGGNRGGFSGGSGFGGNQNRDVFGTSQSQNRGGFGPDQGRSGFQSNQNQNRGGFASNQGRSGFQSNQNQNRGGFASNQGRNDQNSNQNRKGFNSYQNRGGFHSDRGRGRGGRHNGRHQRSDLSYYFGKDDIRKVKEEIETDLTTDRPLWPLSAYGPGTKAPRQLIEGDLEVSMEEMRVHAYLMDAQGEGQQLPQLEATAGSAMEECIQRILSDVDGAIDWVIQGKDEHPNRLDIIRESSNRGRSSRGGRGGRGDFASRVEQPSPNQSSSAGNSTFGHQANQSPFGQPARQGSPFGQPAFGQAPFSQTSTLVQNSPFGSPAQPAFGQSPFGQHQQQTQPASFGQLNENEFAQHQNANQFDQSMQQDQPMVTSPFGQPQQPHNAFGHPDQSEANPFAQAQASANGGFNMSAQQQAAMNGGQMIVEDPPAAMFGLNEQQFKEAYEQAKQAGGFQDGAVPMFAPKSEWRS